jgi:hypothetical protein
VEHDDQAPSTKITRRKVVKTGAKFAYAAPVVVATFKLSEGGALAASCPRKYVFDANGPFGSGCYNCNVTRDFHCRNLRDDSLCPDRRKDRTGFYACRAEQDAAVKACTAEQNACKRATFYNPSTNRCETRQGVAGGEDCAPAFTPVTTP